MASPHVSFSRPLREMEVAISGASIVRQGDGGGTSKLALPLMTDLGIDGPISSDPAGDAYPACLRKSARSIYSFTTACIMNATCGLRWIWRGLRCGPAARLLSMTLI